MSSTIQELYDGKVQLNFQESTGKHRYLRKRFGIDSKFGNVPGVTTIIKDALNSGPPMTWPMYEAVKYIKANGDYHAEAGDLPYWLVDESTLEASTKAFVRKSDVGKDTGTAVHNAIEARLVGKPYEVPPEAQKAITGFEKWLESEEMKGLSVLAAEKIIYSKDGDYAGKFDLLFSLKGRIVLADYKTTNKSQFAPKGVYWDNFIQLGGYGYALTEMDNMSIDDYCVINVGKDGVLNTVYASELGLAVEDCDMGFIAALEIYRLKNKLVRRLRNE